jgi:Flp pilus assembly protein TadD
MRRVSQRSVECAIVGVAALGVFIWWTAQGGGYFSRDWMVGTLLLAGVGASTVVGLRHEIALPSRAALVAIGAFGAYVAWSFLSITWAQTPADALDGSQRALAYLVCFAIFVLLPWTGRTLLAAVLAFVATLAVLAAGTLVRLADGTGLAERFIDGSLLGPAGYHNASAALFAMAGVAALMLAPQRDLPTWLRALMLAAATLLLAVAGLGQSRGLLLTAPIVAVAALLLAPERLRFALFTTPVLGALAIAAADVLAVGRAGSGLTAAAAEPAMRPLVDVAVTTIALVTAGTLMAAVALLALDRRWATHAPLHPALRRRLSTALAAVVLLGGVAAGLVATEGDPVSSAETAWSEFADVDYNAGSTSTGLGSGRYDFWRVAFDAWRDHPVLGLGQDNFIEEYTARRRTQEEPRWVHSLPLRLLAHTGLVGMVLFVAFLVAAGCGIAGAWRASRLATERAVIGAACLPAVVWLAHGEVDWLWEVPAVSLAALTLAGAALSLRTPARGEDAPPRSRRTQRLIATGTVATALCIAVVIVPAFVSDREVALANQVARQDPAGAYARLDRAAALNPLSPDPALTEGRIAQERGDLRRARIAFAEAAKRSPRAWYPCFALGLAASADGDRREARRQLQASLARNPRDPLIVDALRRVEGANPLGFAEARRRMDARRRIQRVQRG